MPVGVEDGRIPDGALTASSYYSENYHPSRARLNLLSSKNSWAPKNNDANQWLQVCFYLFSPFAFHCNRRAGTCCPEASFWKVPITTRPGRLFLFTNDVIKLPVKTRQTGLIA